jgi:hypothetical protein
MVRALAPQTAKTVWMEISATTVGLASMVCRVEMVKTRCQLYIQSRQRQPVSTIFQREVVTGAQAALEAPAGEVEQEATAVEAGMALPATVFPAGREVAVAVVTGVAAAEAAEVVLVAMAGMGETARA